MLYWWEVAGGRGTPLGDPHQHDGVFSALACMESAQRGWDVEHPGVTLDLRLIQLDGCIADFMPEDREEEIRAAFANWRKSRKAPRGA